MIELNEVLSIHQFMIEKFGGSPGVRDLHGLMSALSRPFMTFEETELYPSPVNKASAILESIVTNHPFIDGNKRIGYVIMRLLLLKFKNDVNASQDEKYDFVISIASGKMNIGQINSWLEDHCNEVK